MIQGSRMAEGVAETNTKSCSPVRELMGPEDPESRLPCSRSAEDKNGMEGRISKRFHVIVEHRV